MKYRTPKNQRATYYYQDENGAKITLRPGEDGITEADVSGLHRADDDALNNDKKHSRTDRKTVTGFVPLDTVYSELEMQTDADPTLDAVIAMDDARRLHRAIKQLSDKQAKVVTAVYLENMTAREYAQKTGTAESTVSITLNRAIKNLRKILGE